jgi:hypothetical protein
MKEPEKLIYIKKKVKKLMEAELFNNLQFNLRENHKKNFSDTFQAVPKYL